VNPPRPPDSPPGDERYQPLRDGHMADPSADHRRLRSECPVYHSAAHDLYVISRYDDVVAAGRDVGRFSSATPSSGQRVLAAEALAENVGSPPPYPPKENLATVDPPLHTLNRKVMTAFFSPRYLRGLEPTVRAVAAELLDGFADRGQVEFVAEYATWLPMTVITAVLGFPPGEVGQLKGWSDAFARGLSADLTVDTQRAMVRATRLITEHVLYHAELRRRAPGDDLISHLTAAVRDDGTRLDDRDIASLALTALVGGNETTTNLLGGMLLLLVDHPDALAALRADLSLADGVVEEALRLVSPTQALYRVTTQPVELRGSVIPAGRRVHLLWGSANRDESVFTEPDRFDIFRANARQHVAFGTGPHFCVGSPLARLEAKVTLQTVIPRLRNLRRSSTAAAPRWKRHFHLRGLETLPLEFDP